ncbi:hypothetical protein AB0H94_21130 [Streptomyces purpurascens]|uniref:hypothetical protein n=1 Tax=Streptomyces purpurascens TaxID=1924 RepID=UPI0033FE4CEF
MNRYAKRGLPVTGPSTKDSAAGGRPAPKVPHAEPETEPAAIIADYWDAAKARYRRGDFPDYGSEDWRALPIEDPRKLAGLVAFAEMWRKYGDEIADDLNRQLAHPEPLWQRATTEACDKAFRDLLAQQEHRRKEAA